MAARHNPMKNAYRILWLSPYRRGRVASVTRGLRLYSTIEEAQAQIARYQATFPGNRYSVEPY